MTNGVSAPQMYHLGAARTNAVVQASSGFRMYVCEAKNRPTTVQKRNARLYLIQGACRGQRGGEGEQQRGYR
jgi:hypothetical protein